MKVTLWFLRFNVKLVLAHKPNIIYMKVDTIVREENPNQAMERQGKKSRRQAWGRDRTGRQDYGMNA